jgi:hypothetical protein
MTQIEFEHIDIELRIKDLVDDISTRRKNVQLNKHTQKNFDHWITQLDTILNKIIEIEDVVLPAIQQDLEDPITNKNLVINAMIQPSVKKTFSEIKTHFKNESDFVLLPKELALLESCSDFAKSLAWIGDTTIKYTILLKIWKPGIKTKDLHNQRESFEKNDNLSRLCDTWKLYDNRIHFDPSVPKQATINKIKGTLVEAIYGVIFIECGIDGVFDALHLIDLANVKNRQ